MKFISSVPNWTTHSFEHPVIDKKYASRFRKRLNLTHSFDRENSVLRDCVVQSSKIELPFSVGKLCGVLPLSFCEIINMITSDSKSIKQIIFNYCKQKSRQQGSFLLCVVRIFIFLQPAHLERFTNESSTS